MDDLISRPTAVDAVVDCTNCGTEDVLREYVTKHSLENGWTGGIVDALDAIEQLPSVQPERPTGEWIQKPRYEDDEYPDAQPNLKCPFCGYEIGWYDMGNYCARCGADLKGGAE